MQRLYPLFVQYHVRQVPALILGSIAREGLATIIVFADSREVACARASRLVAENKLEIIQLARIHLIGQEALQGLNTVLLSLYRRAELYGISFYCDYWPIGSGYTTVINQTRQT